MSDEYLLRIEEWIYTKISSKDSLLYFNGRVEKLHAKLELFWREKNST